MKEKRARVNTGTPSHISRHRFGLSIFERCKSPVTDWSPIERLARECGLPFKDGKVG